jgi:hypothetical protein
LAGKGNPRLTIRVPAENLAAYQRMADFYEMDVTDWARYVLDNAAISLLKEPTKPPPKPADAKQSVTAPVVEVRLTQLEQEAADLERESPFKR